ncbi:hypothetical protein [Pseudarthrobacter sp. NIBRBAC000502771]|uniref:hypothetical protein n=1 Tax=Pseudarthrobacter sp. NIBRBAC000502771 TaxID=2590774 RepID=UPI0011310E15|nr:hypothetical protein [Pseudarthrobacter sp. NIBRBAC000502771]QDG61690.1 hypothetical protein NIBR502771_04770 [Pseudarthrobacter sp. NIBRBAC000502771]
MPDETMSDSTRSDANRGGMPLAAKRLVLLGGLGIPVGLVAGPYLLGLQLLAVAGVVAIAVALSYRQGSAWFSGWSWVTACAGLAWTGATVAYWLTIIAAADASAPAPPVSSVLFSVGVTACLVMAGAVLAAAVCRYRDRRRSARAEHQRPGTISTS